MDNLKRMLTALRSKGKKVTPQRLAVCRILIATDTHPTAHEIYAALLDEYPTLSLATVYNTLDTLVRLGMVNALGSAGDDAVHYDADTQPHVNLACIRCHRVIDLPSEHITHVDAEIVQNSQFKLLGARVLYYGICPNCQHQHPSPTN
jgi:Fur family transcriptional regulator, peroxide stress response regulator